MLPTETITCPYCWEAIEILIDDSAGGAQWTEDCQVCCRPILVSYDVAIDGSVRVLVEREND